MEQELLLNCGGNLATIGFGLLIYIVWKRCVHSKCAIHSTIIDCESPEIKQLKYDKQKTMLKQVLNEIQIETQRDSINGESI